MEESFIEIKEYLKGKMLVAIDPCTMERTGEKTLTVGKQYKPLLYDIQFYITDDHGDDHWFDYDDLSVYFNVVEIDKMVTKNKQNCLLNFGFFDTIAKDQTTVHGFFRSLYACNGGKAFIETVTGKNQSEPPNIEELIKCAEQIDAILEATGYKICFTR